MKDNLEQLFREQVIARLRDEQLFGCAWFQRRFRVTCALLTVFLGMLACGTLLMTYLMQPQANANDRPSSDVRVSNNGAGTTTNTPLYCESGNEMFDVEVVDLIPQLVEFRASSQPYTGCCDRRKLTLNRFTGVLQATVVETQR